MMVDKVIEQNGLKSRNSGFSLNIRLPWYRSLPLSTVEVVSVAVDEAVVPAQSIRFALNERNWSLSELPRLTDQVWFVLDTGQLWVSGVALKVGSTHAVEVVLALYPPYIKGLRRMVRWTKQLEVQ